ncbi:hypothetical protein R1sor_015811 [Riccia sorocarpa]|uniref:Jacalin-type lectin domain-containing protein n=1 Tax=Riccia sorocarpa TaxID=122646 RepID=A0ABD3HGD5_9MARC
MTSELQTTPDPFSPPSVNGGDGGGEFSYCGGTDGKTLHEIDVWAGRIGLKAISVRLTNDTTASTFGSTNKSQWQNDEESALSHKKFTFNPGERITSLSIWNNGLFDETSDGFRQSGIATRVGWIFFKTDHNREFDIGMYYLQRVPEAEIRMPVGSGICVGVRGRAGWDIDSLGFVFLEPIVGAKLLDVEYRTLTADTPAISEEALDELQERNLGTSSQPWIFSGSKVVNTRSSWIPSLNSGLTGYLAPRVEAKVPRVVVTTHGKFEWSLSTDIVKTDGFEISSTEELRWNETGISQPTESFLLRASTGCGTISVPITGDVEVCLENGYEFRYKISGEYSGLSFSPARIHRTIGTNPSTLATEANNASSSSQNQDENQTSTPDVTEVNPGSDAGPGNDIMRDVFDAFEAMPQPPQQSENDVVAKVTLGMTSIRRITGRSKLLQSCGFVICTVERGPSYDDMLEWVDTNISQKANVTISEMWVLDDRNYLVTVDSEKARRVVFMSSPYYYNQNMVLILPWRPGYGIQDMQPKLIPTWVNVHGVGPLFSEEGGELLAAIGPVLGSEKDCCRTARTPHLRGCVLLDIKQPHPSRLEISAGDKKVDLLITYDKLPDVCFACHKRGHTANFCHDILNQHTVNSPPETVPT